MGAAFLNAEFGFNNEPSNAAYLASLDQLLKDDSRAIVTARVQGEQGRRVFAESGNRGASLGGGISGLGRNAPLGASCREAASDDDHQ